MIYSQVVGSGSVLPKKRLTNEELSQFVETSDEWITSRTGIRARHVAGDTETASTMATEAARAALERSGIPPESIDTVIVATCTGDYVIPSTACVVQKNLGLKPGCAFDVQGACSGFCYALSSADLLIRAGKSQGALVIGSETLTRLVDWSDRSTCVLFGDGAGAVVLKPSEEQGIIDSILYADGNYLNDLYVPNLNCGRGPNHTTPYLQMNGKEVFKLAVQKGQQLVREILEKNEVSFSELDWLIPHQANIRIVDFLAEQCGFPKEKIAVTIDEQGNTSAASVPLAWDAYWQKGLIQKGQKLLTLGFGSGFTWAANLIQL